MILLEEDMYTSESFLLGCTKEFDYTTFYGQYLHKMLCYYVIMCMNLYKICITEAHYGMFILENMECNIYIFFTEQHKRIQMHYNSDSTHFYFSLKCNLVGNKITRLIKLIFMFVFFSFRINFCHGQICVDKSFHFICFCTLVAAPLMGNCIIFRVDFLCFLIWQPYFKIKIG